MCAGTAQSSDATSDSTIRQECSTNDVLFQSEVIEIFIARPLLELSGTRATLTLNRSGQSGRHSDAARDAKTSVFLIVKSDCGRERLVAPVQKFGRYIGGVALSNCKQYSYEYVFPGKYDPAEVRAVVVQSKDTLTHFYPIRRHVQ
jgi:hypothetical protein